MTEPHVELALDVCWEFLGLPYVWGGDDPVAGFDCSGLVIEALKSVGGLPRRGDWTADGLWRRFRAVPESDVAPGDLVYWLNHENRATHVGIVWKDPRFYLGAEGGGPRNQTREDAIRRNAYVQLRPLQSRGPAHRRRFNRWWEAPMPSGDGIVEA